MAAKQRGCGPSGPVSEANKSGEQQVSARYPYNPRRSLLGDSTCCCQAVAVNSEGNGAIWTIVVAAGSGSRFGAAKQFLDLAGVSVLDRSVLTAARHSDGVVVVVPPSEFAGLSLGLESSELPDGFEWRVVTGGSTRSESVRNGLAAVPQIAEFVLVHDAARPLASDSIFERVIAAVSAGADAATPVVAVTDTIRFRSGDALDRDELVAVQTPQAFRAEILRRVHQQSPEATDDVSLVSDAGGRVELVSGEQRNLKLTTPYDLEVAAFHLSSSGES
ncbi:MAG: 2-C-methyl-D-erythritol 4-phosphate cytidylyltransferase [Acidimicrobiaceae bacterium]|nr:2-C-methyl-D-erythritol 4-phosphate cytidylyltransferase [Acidimicrobiaceae bacterium]MXW75354.1 2-C-methyl-D-erythritol 4-phosphate cytidylyltransferase [Acidimicrobiaceae bacterium]MYA75900.1 2-C-methyl-D-erythritol 4-phosphate cytidylyltransferase [Acidimicrobiaceae bacterium]MYC41723.1 2-C-methyl-D-erythritol 4-phosphate cytidylyltransferase [Acidimicrobiaceae bacterium]MYD06967.1 2-C-methyl-D-erythritol 4-phosphate cytidylyltransferase [Acidimicrobiaceae bacterium]